MKGSHSRLLQVVVAAMLVNVAPDGRAETFNLDRVEASYPEDYRDDSWSYDWDIDDYSVWDVNDYSDSGSGSGGDTSDTVEVDVDKKAECDAIAANVSSTCDLMNPPVLVANGCGSGVSTYLVPDYLTVNGIPVLRLGPIFMGACNLHDTCYGTYGNSKESCDMSLHSKMISNARIALTDAQWSFYGPYVKLQAFGYSAGLQAPFISYFSGNAFASAQLDGACRYFAKKAEGAGCIY